MIMTYLKIVAAVIMLAQPADRVAQRVAVSNAVAATRSPEMPAKPAPHSTKATPNRSREARGEKLKAAVQVVAAKPAQPKSSDAPPARIAGLETARKAGAASGTARATNAVPPLANVAPQNSNSDTRATQQQVMAAMTAAELLTTFRAVAEPGPKTTDADRLVAIVMARPEIKSVSDLAGKNVAIDGRKVNGHVRTAIAAAGATAVQLSEDQIRAVDRLISGEVPAAVLTLVSPEAADKFPEIPGYRIFRVPLSPL